MSRFGKGKTVRNIYFKKLRQTISCLHQDPFGVVIPLDVAIDKRNVTAFEVDFIGFVKENRGRRICYFVAIFA